MKPTSTRPLAIVERVRLKHAHWTGVRVDTDLLRSTLDAVLQTCLVVIDQDPSLRSG
jgi:hypothetical protein